jgi:hypothetical protein
MLRRLFNRSTAAAPKVGPQLCMPAFRSDEGLTTERIIAAWSELFPRADPLEGGDGDQEVLGFRDGDRTLFAAVMPIPIPAGDIRYACEGSWMWPEAAEKVKEQQVHAVIMGSIAASLPGAVQEAVSVTRLAAAMCTCGDAVGVYWGNGGQVHSPEFFIDAAQGFDADDTLPCMLWVGLRVSAPGPSGPFTLTTQGMAPLGHKELEVIDTAMAAGDLRMKVYEAINYLLTSGPVFKHGQTFGPTAEDRWKIEHATSRFRRGEPVIRLHIP